ncbi:hypothetical protein FGO68_gene12753 [Halteria grandinella]|uniref:Uncharacterized protein n=1 Tax=Halteria grandinella TaxID=5974 RepID=A0A8J8NL80_HALGN|nr:hypothetical protein FGO68_gene12753 [Halteria grandinella]
MVFSDELLTFISRSEGTCHYSHRPTHLLVALFQETKVSIPLKSQSSSHPQLPNDPHCNPTSSLLTDQEARWLTTLIVQIEANEQEQGSAINRLPPSNIHKWWP